MTKLVKLIDSDKSINVSDHFFDKSKLLQNWEDDELVLTEEYYEENIIKCIDKYEYDHDCIILSKIICLMDMLDMEYNSVMERLITKLDTKDKINYKNVLDYFDKKFIVNYKLVKLLFLNSNEKSKIKLMKLPLNFTNVTFNSKIVTQKNFDNSSIEFKNNLINLNINDNNNINNVNMFVNLEELNSCNNNLGDDGISQLKKLKIINMKNNTNITNLNHFELLEELYAFDCNMNQKAISELKNIKWLDISENSKINDLNHLLLLENLNVSGYCGVTQQGISQLQNLKNVVSVYNDKINVKSELCNKIAEIYYKTINNIVGCSFEEYCENENIDESELEEILKIKKLWDK